MSVSVSRGSPVTSPRKLPRWPSCVDGVMTVLTNNKRFSSPSRHPFYPGGFFWSSFTIEIGQFADVVNFDVLFAPTHFTGICKQSFDEFAACSIEQARRLILQHDLFLSS